MNPVRRTATLLEASGTLILLSLLAELRPGLPAHSPPNDSRQLKEWLAIALWIVLVIAVLGLLVRVLKAGSRRAGRPHESRLGRALNEPRGERFVEENAAGDWHRYARALERPSLRFKHSATATAATIASEHRPTIPPDQAPDPSTDAARTRSESDQSKVGIRLLGPFELSGTERARPRLAATTELIVYLALHPQGATREELLNALWPDEEPRSRDQRFWQATSEARKLLRGGLLRKRDRYSFDPRHLRIDLDQLTSLLEQASHTEGQEAEQALLERALSLFRGRPLEGSDYVWADGTVRHLSASYLDLLRRTARARLAAGDAQGAIELAERGLGIDQLQEELWQVALQAEATLGQREAVRRRYDQLVSVLDGSVGLEPTRETRALYLQLLGQR